MVFNSMQIALGMSLIVLGVIVLLLVFWYYRLSRAAGMVLLTAVAPKEREPACVSPAAPAESEMAIGVQTGLFYEKDVLEVLQPIREAGYTTVEIWGGPQRWGEYTHFNWHKGYRVHALSVCLKVLGLKVHSLHAPFSDTLDLSHPNELKRKYAVTEVLKTMEVLKFLGGEYLVVHPASNETSLQDREARFRQSRKSIEELYSCLQGTDVKLAVENQLPHILGGDAGTLLELIKDFPPQQVGICFDFSHANLYQGQRPEQTLEALAGRLFTLHVSDNYGRNDDHFIPGDGTVNWQAAVEVLRRCGYRGVFMLEILSDANRSDKIHVLCTGYQRARELLARPRVPA
jgi:sugar phosphate isomerase/epimerase